MLNRLLLITLCLPIFVFTACDNGVNKFSIVGEIQNMPEQTVYLEELNVNDIVILDSTETDKRGKFELSGKAPEPALYRLRFEQQKFILVSVDKGTAKITGDWTALESHKITGSAPSASLQSFLLTVREHLRDFQTMGAIIEKFQAEGNDSLLTRAKNDMQQMNFEFTRYIEQYADTTKYLPNALFAVRMLNPGTEKEFLTTFVENIGGRFPNTKLAKDFADNYNRMIAGENMQQASPTGPAPGDDAPDFTLNDISGKNVSLSSFKGKYVLVDFWASWCAPCRRENPNVVAAYNKYKNKNFTILGVSLDNDKEKWQEAVKKDGLAWSHVSDLKGWESEVAATYAVQAIPANFLLDPEGKVIARDLRAEALEAKLAEVLK